MSQSGFLAAILIGFALRLLLIATSIGTNDVPFMILWAKLAREEGIAGAYGRMWELNHPPLSLLLIHLYDGIARVLQAQFTDVLRFFQVLSDGVTLFALSRLTPDAHINRMLGAFFALSPVAIFVSGFHCNTDSMLVALMLLSVLAATRERSGAAGILLAAAVGIKIVALFIFPFMLVAQRKRALFFTAFAAATAAIFIPIHFLSAGAMTRNVFGYSGFSGKWGVTAILLALHDAAGGQRGVLYETALLYARAGKYVVVTSLAALFLIYLTRISRTDEKHAQLLKFVPLIYIALLVFAPGFGVQYLLWPLPLLPILFQRQWTLLIHGIAGFYLFFAYTIWSGGFPWWYADSVAPSPFKASVVTVGIFVWLLYGVALVVGVRDAVVRKTVTPF